MGGQCVYAPPYPCAIAGRAWRIDTSLSSKGDTVSSLVYGESQGTLNVIFRRMHQDDGAKSSIKMFANIFISFIGAGILGMPHAFKEVCKVLAFARSNTVRATNAYLENEGFGQLNRTFLSH